MSLASITPASVAETSTSRNHRCAPIAYPRQLPLSLGGLRDNRFRERASRLISARRSEKRISSDEECVMAKHWPHIVRRSVLSVAALVFAAGLLEPATAQVQPGHTVT